MPRWWKSLCRQARLHSQKEPRRARESGRRRLREDRGPVLDTLEQRVLLSSTLTNGLQSHWQLDETSGVIAVDAAGNNDFDVLNGSVFDSIGGYENGALSFDGIDDKAEAGDVLDPFSGDYTVSLWFKRPAGGTINSDQFLISKGNRYSTREGWSINISDDTQEIRLRVNSSDSTAERASTEIDLPIDDEWHHLVMVVDRTEGRVLGYLDGSNDGWRSGGGGPSSSSLSSVTDIDTDDPLTLGAVRDGANTHHNFEGLLDNVRIYDRALSEGEIDSLVHPPRLNEGLVAHYRADGTSGTDAVDEQGGNSLQLFNGADFAPTDGYLNGALSFDGVDDKAEALSDVDAFDIGSGDYAISLWFKRPQGGTIDGDQVLISKGNRYSTREGWSVIFSGTTQEIRFRVNSSDDSSERASTEVDVPQDDAWHHLVLVVDRVDNQVRGYLDGSNDGWRSGGGGPSSYSLSTVTDINTDDPFTIGAVRDGTGTHYQFEGLVDEVRLYNRVLEVSEVAALSTEQEENNPPVANPDTATTVEGQSVVIDVLANDTDPDAGDVLSIVSFTQPGNGTVTDNGDGTLTYEPVAGFTGSENITYTIIDSNGAQATAPIDITIEPSGELDSDGDGLTDAQEIVLGTNPNSSDTDGDQMPDGWEYLYWDGTSISFDPRIQNDSSGDFDVDGLTDLDEFYYGSSPHLEDTDSDGTNDGDEVLAGRDPNYLGNDIFSQNYAKLRLYASSQYIGGGPSGSSPELSLTIDGRTISAIDTEFASQDIYVRRGENYRVIARLPANLSNDFGLNYRITSSTDYYTRLAEGGEFSDPHQQGLNSFGYSGGSSYLGGVAGFSGPVDLVIPDIQVIANDGSLPPMLVDGKVLTPFIIRLSENISDIDFFESKHYFPSLYSSLAIYKDSGSIEEVAGGYGNPHSLEDLGLIPGQDKVFYVGRKDGYSGPLQDEAGVNFRGQYSYNSLNPLVSNTDTIQVSGMALIPLVGIDFDLDIDSDNSNGFDTPDRTASEDAFEDDERGAKIVVVNRDDSDHDGLVDYADGYGAFDATSNAVVNEQFVPIKFQIPDGAGLSDVVRFVYSDSSPDLVYKTPQPQTSAVGLDGETYSYEEYGITGDGLLRLWNAADPESRSATDYIAANQDYALSNFTVGVDGAVTLLVEAVKGAATPTQITVYFEGQDGRVGADSVYVLPLDPEVGIASDDIEGITVHREAGSNYYGGAGNDLFFGTDADERFESGGGHDIIFTGGGDDSVEASEFTQIYASEYGSQDINFEKGDRKTLIQNLKTFKQSGGKGYSFESFERAMQAYGEKYDHRNPYGRLALKLHDEGLLSIRFSEPADPTNWWQEVANKNKEVMFQVSRTLVPLTGDLTGPTGYRYLINVYAPVQEPVMAATALHLAYRDTIRQASDWFYGADDYALGLIETYSSPTNTDTHYTVNSEGNPLYEAGLANMFDAAAATSELYLQGIGVISIGAEVALVAAETEKSYIEGGLYAAVATATIATVLFALPVATPGAARFVYRAGGEQLGKIVSRAEDLLHTDLDSRIGAEAFNTTKLTQFADQPWYENVTELAFVAGTEKAIILQEPGIFYRYVDSSVKSLQLGSGFLTPVTFGSSEEAIKKLALPTDAAYLQMVRLDVGTEIIVGKVRGRSGDPGFPADAPGGAEQIYVLDRGDNVKILDFNIID